MIAADIIDAIEAQGARLVLVDGSVKLRSMTAIPAGLRAEARDRRAEISALLSATCNDPFPIREFAFWKAVFEDIESWPPVLQHLFVDRADVIEATGLERDAADATAYLELRDVARAPSPACRARALRGLGDRAFELVCRRAIRRPAPSTAEDDARVAAEILRVHGSRT